MACKNGGYSGWDNKRLSAKQYQQLLRDWKETLRYGVELRAEVAKGDSQITQSVSVGGGYNWWVYYDLSFVQLLGVFVCLFGWSDKLKELSGSEDASAEFMEWASSEAAEPRISADSHQQVNFLLNIVQATIYSLEAIGLYGLSINELLYKARSGDRMAFIKAMHVDRCVVSSKTGSELLADAQLRTDRRFLNSIFKRMRAPHKRLKIYADTRALARFLSDVGDYTASSGREIEALVLELGLPAPRGSKDIHDQMRKFVRAATV